jgi:uncharacterized protein YfaS (alpha-2-macroglobulin family)
MDKALARGIVAGWAIALAMAVNAQPGPSPAPPVTGRLDERDLWIEFSEAMTTLPNAIAPGTISIDGFAPLDCNWDDDESADCTLAFADRAANATSYTVRVGAGLSTQAGQAFAPTSFTVETGRPQLHLSVEAWNRGLPTLWAVASLPATEAQVAAVLRVQRDGVPVSYRLEPVKVGRWRGAAGWRVVPDGGLEAGGSFELASLPGLRTGTAPLAGRGGETLKVRVDRVPQLRGLICSGPRGIVSVEAAAGVVAAACVPDEPVTLRFSQAPDRASLERWVAGWPADVRFEAKPADYVRPLSGPDGIEQAPDAYVRLKLGHPLANVELAVPPTLASERGQAFAPARIALHATHVRPALRVPHGKALVAAGNDAVPLANVVAAQALDVAIVGVGADSGVATLRLDATRERDVAEPVLSARTQRWLREGGWVRWKLDEKAAAGYTEMELAAPEFDLWASWAPREVLAWANAWDGSGPVAGAAVELLRLAPGAERATVVASGRTLADGTVVLGLPDDVAEAARDYAHEAPPPLWLVRVANGANAGALRAVLPLATRGWGTQFGEARTRWAWGVSDSPLYRAGDIVKFRLWLREQGDGRVRRPHAAQDVTLLLAEFHDDDKPLRQWKARADASGAIVGEVRVPEHAADGPYCIKVDGVPGGEGACFYVGTFRAQDLWVQLALDRSFVRTGDPVGLAATAGYYSGGAAAGVPVRFETGLRPLPVAEAYPAFNRYEFTDVDPDDGSAAWRGIEQASVTLDADGRAAKTAPLAWINPDDEDEPAGLPLLGRLEVTAEARASDREGTQSVSATATFARVRRFVGLRLEGLYEPGAPARIDAVVVTAEGTAVDGAAVDVEVFRPADDEADDEDEEGDGKPDPARRVGQCRVSAGRSAPCDFRREHGGDYVFRASSPGAEAVQLHRYVPAGYRRIEAATQEPQPSLSLLAAPATPGAPARLLLRQPHAHARVLLVVRQAGVLWHRVQDVDAGPTVVELPTDAGWVGRVEVSAIIRDAAPAQVQGPYRTPPATAEASVDLVLPKTLPGPPPVSIAFAADAPRPGARARVVVRNDSNRERAVTVAVMDDAIRALAGEWAGTTDPAELQLMGRVADTADWRPNSFAQWRDPVARAAALPWPDDEIAGAQAGRERRRGRPQSQTVTESMEPSPVAVAAPAGVEEFQYSGLDTISVTGTRIQEVRMTGRAPPDGVLAYDAARAALALARVRSDFRDTAFWVPDVRLAPGESRTLEFELPDNLTRWRALAWSSDADEDFAVAEATQAAGLPIEARLQAPVRIYPGDTAVVAANVRRAEASNRPIEASLDADGAGVHDGSHRAMVIDGAGQSSLALAIAPRQVGQVAIVAAAATAREEERDAVATAMEVASPKLPARLVQAGWIGDAGVQVPMPALPAGATDAGLRVTLMRGGAGLVDGWTHDLQAYPHRCWEQILSRAVAAALALERHDASWPDAAAVVREALDNAAVFQDSAGDFRYFVPSLASDWHYVDYEKREYGLTAYSVRALELLRALGHDVDPAVIERARDFLERRVGNAALDKEASAASGAEAVKRDQAGQAADTLALALGGLDATGKAKGRSDAPPPLDQAWTAWERQSLPARIATTRALLRANHPAAGTAVERLLAQAPRQGESRHFTDDDARSLRWMGSDLQEQCAVIGLLGEFPAADPGGTARRQLLAGLSDLYAGGVEAIDTNAGASCLLALRTLRSDAAPVQAHLAYAGAEHALALEPGVDRTAWSATGAPQGTLRLERGAGSGAASYLAEVDYVEDARVARASAVGLRLERRYEVHRGASWHPLGDAPLREGDWVRITLVVETSRPRHFVAVTDALPGGLQPADPQLRGVIGAALDALTDPGSAWFGTRRLDPRTPRFYAEWLPRGRHEVHYFARVGNRGDYLAAPAQLELMYGAASRARTAAARVRIEPVVAQ